jgi:hemerythrin-like domain-containing protein
MEVKLSECEEILSFIKEFKENFPHVKSENLLIEYRDEKRSH